MRTSTTPNAIRFAAAALTLTGLGFAILSVPPVHAQTVYTWTNADGTDNNWTNAGNWNPSSGTPGGNVGDDAIFSGSAAGIGTANVNVSTLNFTDLDLQSAGWNLSGGQFRIQGTVGSAGAGTNVIGSLMTSSGGARTHTVGSGNTLQIDTLNIQWEATFAGGGTAAVQNVSGGNRGLSASGAGTRLIMNGTMTSRLSHSRALAGGMIGGTGTFILGGDAGGARYVQTDGVGSILAPGGDGGSYGSEFATLSVSTDPTNVNGAERVILGHNTIFQINLGDQAGINSRVDIEHNTVGATGGYLHILSGVELRLLGDPGLPTPGDFTLATFNNPNQNLAYGTFSSVTYNGSLLSSGTDYSLAYNENDIILTVIPEPGTLVLVLLAGLGMLVFRRIRS